MVDMNNEYDIILSVKDLQGILKCGKNKAYALMKLEDFPSFIINNRYYVEKNNFLKWLSKQNKRKRILLFD